MALQVHATLRQMGKVGALPAGQHSCVGSRLALPARRQQSTRLRHVLVHAEGGSGDSLFASGAGKITGKLYFSKDTETFQDVFAFTGELPERLNGRVAMWSFAALALTEWRSGQSVLQQAVAHPIAATSFSLLITVASLAPKFAAGVSLKELHGAASRDNLPRVLAFFNKTHELWLGRIAMLGLVGLPIVEIFVKGGSPLF